MESCPYEVEFLTTAVIKIKVRTKSIVKQEMRVVVSNLIPRFENVNSAQGKTNPINK